MDEQNKTTIRLEIDKTIQPKQFEPIKIIVDLTETFCWKDKEDRDAKIKLYTEKLSDDFVSTFNIVAKKIGEENRCIGKVITSGDVPNTNNNQPSNIDDEWDIG